MSSLPHDFLSEPDELLGGGLEGIKARNLYLARKIADYIFDSNGKISLKSLKILCKYFEERLYLLSPFHALDGPMRDWIREALKALVEEESLRQAVDKFYRPVAMPYGDELIKLTLDLPGGEVVEEVHARKSAVVSLLTYFRQNVGSCFATAPAIQILQERRELFLEEAQELLATGKMKRVVEGQEYAVPLSPNWGLGHLTRPIEITEGLHSSYAFRKALLAARVGNIPEILERLSFNEEVSWDIALKAAVGLAMKLPEGKRSSEEFVARYNAAKQAFLSCTENALLRSWEYTLASFSEAKSEFVGWNLYHSLGVDSDQPDGIGTACFRFLTEKVEQLKKEIDDLQMHYERIFIEVKTLESRAQRASSQNEEWVGLEFRTRVNEMEGVLAQRDAAHHKAERLTGLYPLLIEAYKRLFPSYFQEIYDAGMTTVMSSIFDDSPAGFRLLFKHGRSNPSAWTFVYNADQFIQALSQFFTMAESAILDDEQFAGLEKELTEMVSEIILAIRSPHFLEGAMARVKKIHERGLPWEYVSGGSLVALLSTVYGPNSIKEPAKKVIEAPEELLIFLIETFKDHPPKGDVLATSPTHAFIVKPQLEEFNKAWDNSLYTFSWVRDNVLVSRRNFFEVVALDQREIEALVAKWCGPLKKELVQYLRAPLNGFELVRSAAEILKQPMLLSSFEAHVYNSLPLFPAEQLKERAEKVLAPLGLKGELKERWGEILTAEDLRKALFQLGATCQQDPYIAIARQMEQEGFAAPRALIFADTNWSREYFAFHVGLRTGHLELVLSDYTGSSIRPLGEWRQYLDGRVKEPWALYL